MLKQDGSLFWKSDPSSATQIFILEGEPFLCKRNLYFGRGILLTLVASLFWKGDPFYARGIFLLDKEFFCKKNLYFGRGILLLQRGYLFW